MKKDAASGRLSVDLLTARLTVHLAAGVTLSQVEKIIDAINVLHLELTGKPIRDVTVVAGAGLCRHCTEPLAPGSIAHCVAHVLKYRARNRARAKSSAWQPGGPGRPPLVLP